MPKVYTQIAHVARPPKETITTLGYDSYESILGDVLRFDKETVRRVLESGEEGVMKFLASHNYRIQHGLLVHTNGMLDAGSYYPMQVAWPDMYIECSSCGGDKFVSKLARAQRLRHAFGLPEVEVRLPDTEIPELEAHLVHPGRYVDRVAALAPIEEHLAQLGREIGKIAEAIRAGELDKDTGRRKTTLLNEEIKSLREASRRELYENIMSENPAIFTESEFALPDVVLALLKQYLQGVDEAIAMIQ